MARKNSQTFLGFEDEHITDENKHLVDFKTNKIGGIPDIPNVKWEQPTCPLCQFPQLLIIQIYVPLEGSSHHRILYLFACINSSCSMQSESWTCLRVQIQDKVPDMTAQSIPKILWETNEDWGDDNYTNKNEENGNAIRVERMSDEDDSLSLDESFGSEFHNLALDDKNANTDAQGGAVGKPNPTKASAEIEEDEGQIITIDSPTTPQNNIPTLLQETNTSQSKIFSSENVKEWKDLYFSPIFMSVWEESNILSEIDDKHVNQLLLEYQDKKDWDSCDIRSEDVTCHEAIEKYEESVPPHGDKMFYHFLSKIQKNPGQLLRYGRGEEPLLLHPQLETVRKCQYCQSERIFEFQLLSTVIPKLKLDTISRVTSHLDFGTALIYTCRNSCWSSDNPCRQEVVIIQIEK